MNENLIEYSLVRLFEPSINSLSNHIIKLSDDDRYLRFGSVATDYRIKQYVTDSLSRVNSRTEFDFWFAITCSVGIVATIHIAIRDGVAEFAFTTDIDYRGRKLGQLLFARGYQLITEFCITQIFMTCLSRNSAMKYIARKFGLTVIAHGTESDATLKIDYPVSLEKISEIKISIADKSFRGIINTSTI